MTRSSHARYRIGDWTLDASLNRLERERSEHHPLEPLAAELLAHLARHPGRVLSVDDLVSEVWTGRVVTDSSVYRLIADLRRALGDDARSPRYIETVRKRGYRLVADAEPLDAAPPRPGAAPTGDRAPRGAAEPASRPGGHRARWLVAFAAVLAVGAAGWLATRSDRTATSPSPASVIAVLPPDALSAGTPGYLVDGIGRTVSDRLAAIPELKVIAYQSVREAAQQRADPQAIASRLGADLLLAGSVLASDDPSDTRIRYAATLLSADDAVQLWSRQFDADVGDLFALHETIAEGVARELDLRLAAGIRRRASQARFSDPALVAEFMRAGNQLASGFQLDNLGRAISHFDAVLAGAPEFVPALAGRAVAHLRLFINYHDRSDARLAMARRDVERALSLRPDDAIARYALGYLLNEAGDPAAAREALLRSLELQPSNADALVALGRNLAKAGEVDASIVTTESAVRLDPLNPMYLYELGLMQLNDGRYPAADKNLAAAIALSPQMAEPHLYRAWLQVSWRADTTAANARLRELADAIGDDALMQLLMTAGLWGVFTWTDPAFDDALASWSTDESGGDPAVWHLAMAEVARKHGDEATMRRHHGEAAALREQDVAAQADSPWLLAELAIARAGLGMHDEALAAADRAIALSPVSEDQWNGVDFLWVRGMVLAMLGADREAIEQVRAAARYPTLTTPNALRIDRHWDALFDYPEFVAMMAPDGSAWQVAPPSGESPGQ